MYRPKIHPTNETERKAWEQLISEGKRRTPSALLPGRKAQKWLVISDVHRPFHNQLLWDKMLRLIHNIGSDLYGIVIAGDYLDLYTLATPNEQSLGLLKDFDLDFEYRDGLNGIIELESALHKSTRKCFLFGNHEFRYFNTLNKRDNAKFGAALKNPIEALQLYERGWEVKTHYRDDFFLLGEHLEVIHGNFWGTHAAKAHLDRLPRSIMFGDTHRIQMHRQGSRASYNIGGLFDANHRAFSYAPRTQRLAWANGFAIVNIDDDGCYFADVVNVWDGRFYADGRMY
jgi:hypothetical protein